MSEATEFLKVTVTQPDWLKNQQAVQIVEEELTKALEDTMIYGKRILRREIKRSEAIATKKLYDSVATLIHNTAAGSWIKSGEIYFREPAAKYAYYANNGRRPGRRPPFKAILEWVQAKGIEEGNPAAQMSAAARIRSSIGAYGTFSRHDFVEETIPYVDVAARQNFEAAARRIRQRLGGA